MRIAVADVESADPVAAFADVDFALWRRVMSVNLDSLFRLVRAFLPGTRAAGWGRIVCMASNRFHTGLPLLTPYVASKGGVIGFVRSLARGGRRRGARVRSR